MPGWLDHPFVRRPQAPSAHRSPPSARPRERPKAPRTAGSRYREPSPRSSQHCDTRRAPRAAALDFRLCAARHTESGSESQLLLRIVARRGSEVAANCDTTWLSIEEPSSSAIRRTLSTATMSSLGASNEGDGADFSGTALSVGGFGT